MSAVWTATAGRLLVDATTVYAIVAASLGRRHPEPCALPRRFAPVSVLKPLCGAEPRLYENLAGLCRQQHPCFQLVFGVCADDDPAIGVVHRLQAEFPDCDIALVVDSRVHGRNPKVSNLINLYRAARHAHLVIADSDIAVPPDYLERLAGPLEDPHVGVVTCLYRGRSVDNFWSRLGAAFIDDWFAPSVRVAHAGGSRRFGFGATLALRRDTLNAIGGFPALANRLADDFWLGELTRQSGWQTVLSEVVVETDVVESSLPALWRHELRWLRTIRSLSAPGFYFMFLTFTWPMLLLGCLLAPLPVVIVIAMAGALARCAAAGSPGKALMAPLRDALLLLEWAAALGNGHVHWRGHVMATADSPDLPGTTDAARHGRRPDGVPPSASPG
ncbi:bacteriohopanetetrol glucosamine biosynthesis glycosyltransferase HpnI [Cupriavidus pauculus]|uniref:Fe-S oxidoreductase n=1 Tax=Cupriavidus pauculus TaxID=82633 RepID=A0A2N5C682_9BURK|nr:bacteriohopanetetrol glucosamine biosynthesis glycosyltransferase HpnI [Cupriavidus pauculus]PLP97708.1 Fe-S oxidoreductase [Cupriavidus pauculus]